MYQPAHGTHHKLHIGQIHRNKQLEHTIKSGGISGLYDKHDDRATGATSNEQRGTKCGHWVGY